MGISSVATFGSDLNTAHQQILPLCLPSVSMELFQARASGEILESHYSDKIVDRMIGQLNRYTFAITADAIHSTRRYSIKSTLQSTSTSTIIPGSYVLEMPTQEDRTAIVIFKPGQKSLEDISYMLGSMGDDAQMSTLVLKRATVSPGGVFKLLLVQS